VTIKDRQDCLAVFDSESLPKKEIFYDQRPTGLKVIKAITGFLQYKSAEGLSPVTVSGADYVPRRITGNNDKKVSPKTVYNLYISVASFFTWASREFQIDNPVKGVPRPRVPEDPPVEPFKKEEIELLRKARDFCEEVVTDHRRKFILQRSTSKRDKAILLTLLDTALRAGELCALRVGDVDMKTGKIRMRPGKASRQWELVECQANQCIFIFS
jgi:integrase